MPTRDVLASFFDDYKNLTPAQKALFLIAVAHFIEDLRAGQFRKGLRVKKMQGHDSIWEMTWDDDGRATFQYGAEQVSGEKHIVWRRIGTHAIFKRP
jgi:hypothetical protein